MPIEITVPRLGWSMEEGTFGGWLKQNGDQVSAGEPLFAVESDKVTMDVESLDNGILCLPPGAPEPGAIVVVGQRLGFLLAPGESAPEEFVSVTTGTSRPAAGSPSESVPSAHHRSTAANTPIRAGRTPVTPRARRVAAELGVDTTPLRGSGRGGRIREVDVRRASSMVAAAEGAVPVTTLRRTIARRMMESRQNTAPVTLTTRADATALVALRNQWKLAEAAGPVPSYTDILAKLVAIVLESYPTLGGKAHIGIAVDTPEGLLVPVLRDVAASSLAELASRSRDLIEAARARRLRVEDITGGTFSITNLGGFGIDAFTPIINFPEAAVLGVGAIRRAPVVLESGELAARDQMTLSLTFDHRVADGALAARFLQALVQLIEAPPPAVHCL
jgi:pyruvate dehydrogenase E2 component (dihydrolipoamide acetyltransferase)